MSDALGIEQFRLIESDLWEILETLKNISKKDVSRVPIIHRNLWKYLERSIEFYSYFFKFLDKYCLKCYVKKFF